jgi:hypothetical protein
MVSILSAESGGNTSFKKFVKIYQIAGRPFPETPIFMGIILLAVAIDLHVTSLQHKQPTAALQNM